MKTKFKLKLIYNVIKRLLVQLKSNPASAIGKQPPLDGAQDPLINKRLHLAVVEVDVWAYACVRAISRAVAQLPLLVQESKIIDNKLVWSDIMKGDLYDVINHPNNEEPMVHLMGRWVTSMLASGDGYMLYDSGDNELYYVRPDLVKVDTDKMGRFIGYKISDSVTTISQDPEQLVHIKLVNPSGEYYGFPPSVVIKEQVLTKLELGRYLKAYFKNDALAGSTLTTDQDLMPEQIEELRQEFNKLHQGAENAFNLAILSSGTKLDRLSHNLKDLIPVELSKSIREEILAAYGVPHVLVGVLDDASYANADIQKKLFYENIVLPLVSEIEAFMNLQLVPQFGNNLRLKFDETAIQALQEDTTEKAKRLGLLTGGRRQILTVNEARIDFGYEPIVGHDELDVVVDPFIEPVEEEIDDEEKRLAIIKKRWQAHHSKVLKAEKDYANDMLKFFDDQRNRVLANLDKLTVGGKILPSVLLNQKMLMESKTATSDTNMLFNLKLENRLLIKMSKPTFKKELAKAGQYGVNNVGKKNLTGMSTKNNFRVTEPAVSEVLKDFLNRMPDINQTTYDTILLIVKQAIDEGANSQDVAFAINNAYDTMSIVRAKRVAKTEMNGIINAGNLLGYEQAGATHKEWISAFLPTSRVTHVHADSQIVEVGKSFTVGGEKLKYPGDPAASAGNVINCYCSNIAFEA